MLGPLLCISKPRKKYFRHFPEKRDARCETSKKLDISHVRTECNDYDYVIGNHDIIDDDFCRTSVFNGLVNCR